MTSQVLTSKVSLQALTSKKREVIHRVLTLYTELKRFYIDYFWEISLEELPKNNKSITLEFITLAQEIFPQASSRMCYSAGGEALGLVKSKKELAKLKNHKDLKPKISTLSMSTSHCLEVSKRKTKTFDLWFNLGALGISSPIRIPSKKHKHFSKLQKEGKLKKYFTLTEKEITLYFEIPLPKKPYLKTDSGLALGLDLGVKTLATLSDGGEFGPRIESLIQKVNRCKQLSKGYYRAKTHLKSELARLAKEISSYCQSTGVTVLVVERLNGIQQKTKVTRRVTKNFRRVLGGWNRRFFIDKLNLANNKNGILTWEENPRYTSQQCSCCGHTEKRNRNGKIFLCLGCGYETDADFNAARNILTRFLSGVLGRNFLPRAGAPDSKAFEDFKGLSNV